MKLIAIGLKEAIEQIQRRLQARLPASVNGPVGESLQRYVAERAAEYFAVLQGQMPWRKIAAFYAERSAGFEDREMTPADRTVIEEAATELFEGPVDRLSKRLFNALLAPVAQGYLEGRYQVRGPWIEEAEPEGVITGPDGGAYVALTGEPLAVDSARLAVGRHTWPVPVRVSQWAKANCAEAVTLIDAESKRRLAGIVANGIRDHLGPDGTARAIKDAFGGMRLTRARLIATNEINTAMSTGAFEQAQTENRTHKRWITVGDDKVTPGCQENEGAGRIEINGSFPSGHIHPPRFPNCRCVVAYEA